MGAAHQGIYSRLKAPVELGGDLETIVAVVGAERRRSCRAIPRQVAGHGDPPWPSVPAKPAG